MTLVVWREKKSFPTELRMTGLFAIYYLFTIYPTHGGLYAKLSP